MLLCVSRVTFTGKARIRNRVGILLSSAHIQLMRHRYDQAH